MKYITTLVLMLNLGVAGVYAQQKPIKTKFSGSNVAPTINLQPDTVTDKENSALVLFAAPVLAQNSTAQAGLQGPCGPDHVRFDVDKVPRHPSTQVEPGKALIYVSEVFKKAPGELGDPTLRIGLDGDWVGAVKGNSYFSFSVEPGEHHLCTRWQSQLKRLSREAAFTVFSAEAGKPYYFRARVTYDLGPDDGKSSNIAGMSITLDPIGSDEGRYLVASNPMSVPHPKKQK